MVRRVDLGTVWDHTGISSNHTTEPMTAALWNAQTLTTVTLPEGKWGTIRTALICIACDARIQGNDSDADHWLAAYQALKEAMGE